MCLLPASSRVSLPGHLSVTNVTREIQTTVHYTYFYSLWSATLACYTYGIPLLSLSWLVSVMLKIGPSVVSYAATSELTARLVVVNLRHARLKRSHDVLKRAEPVGVLLAPRVRPVQGDDSVVAAVSFFS
jgi:hypothetical protein